MKPMSNGLNMPTDKNGVYFTVTTMAISDNRSLGKAIRDKDGYFTDIPVAVLGTVTRNNTQYDTPSFIRQIKGPDTTMSMRLSEGTLFGEWGHPFVDLNSQMGMARLLNLDPQKESNHIRSVSVKRADDLGLDLVVMDSKGTGVYKNVFDEAMEDPCRNLAFSLRGISKATFDKRTNVTHRELINLVTFDSGVASGGFLEASKRYMAAKEDLSFESLEMVSKHITADDLVLVRNVAMESFTNTELNELMKAHKVVIGSVELGYIDKRTNTVLEQATGEHRNLVHSFLKVRR